MEVTMDKEENINCKSEFYDRTFTYKKSNNLFRKLENDMYYGVIKDDDNTNLYYISGTKRFYETSQPNTEENYNNLINETAALENFIDLLPPHILETIKDEHVNLYFVNQELLGCLSYKQEKINTNKSAVLMPMYQIDYYDLIWGIAPFIDEHFNNVSDSVDFFDIYEEEKSKMERIKIDSDYEQYYQVSTLKEFFNSAFYMFYVFDEDFYFLCPKAYKFMEEMDNVLKEECEIKNKIRKALEKDKNIKKIKREF